MKAILYVGLLFVSFASSAGGGPLLLDQVSVDQSAGAAVQGANLARPSSDLASIAPLGGSSSESIDRLLNASGSLSAVAPIQLEGIGGQPIGACGRDHPEDCDKQVVPEPATMLTLGIGLLGAGLVKRARKKAQKA